MSLEILVKSGRKGSNPGGFANFYPKEFDNFEGYFKYCKGSKIPKHFSFNASNQPVYEALTFSLANALGLNTSPYFVVLNEKGDVKFRGSEKFAENSHDGRKYYFASKKMREAKKSETTETISSAIIGSEEIYLDSLLIDDVIKKRQNYLYQKDSSGSRVVYVDLGCSFVRCVDGLLSLPNRITKTLSGRHRSGKRRRNILNGKYLISANNSDLVDLGDLIEGVGDLEIPTLNPQGARKVRNLISYEEIESIKKYLQNSIILGIPHFKKREILIEE